MKHRIILSVSIILLSISSLSAKTYESKRPAPKDRLFRSEAVENTIIRMQKQLKNPRLAWMLANCYPNTLDTTVHFGKDEDGEQKVARLFFTLAAKDPNEHLDNMQQLMAIFTNEPLLDALMAAESEAERMKYEYVSVEHLLIGLCECAGGQTATLLKNHRVSKDALLKALQSVRGSSRVTSDS